MAERSDTSGSVLGAVLLDLAAESGWLQATVEPLDVAAWRTPTPAQGWTIAHQVAHLAWTDEQARWAATDPEGFAAQLARVVAGEDGVDAAAERGAQQDPSSLLAAWVKGRDDLAAALAAVPEGTKLPWFGPPMSAASMATARLMETWAHGQDVADALGVDHPATGRLRHVAHLAVRTRDFSFRSRGLTAPSAEVAVRLVGPDGDPWVWGDPAAAQSITGPAVDFCLVATQRRHRADTALVATGPDADRWLDVAQAFAGPPGAGREPHGSDG